MSKIYRYLGQLVFFYFIYAIQNPLTLRAETAYQQSINPLSALYVNQLSTQLNRLSLTSLTWPDQIYPSFSRFNLYLGSDGRHGQPLISCDNSIYLPWMIIDSGATFDCLNTETFLEGNRFNLLIGRRFYGFSHYFRVGYDFLPWGRHHSAVISGQNLLSQRTRHVYDTIIAVGLTYEGWRYQIQSAIERAGNHHITLWNTQYTQQNPTLWMQYCRIQYALVGWGLSVKNRTAELINCYGEVGYWKIFQLCFEYINHDLLPIEVLSPNAFHIENACHFAIFPLIKLPITVAFGYESSQSNRTTNINIEDLSKHYFIAIQSQLWRKRIKLTGIFKKASWHHKTESVLKVAVSL